MSINIIKTKKRIQETNETQKAIEEKGKATIEEQARREAKKTTDIIRKTDPKKWITEISNDFKEHPLDFFGRTEAAVNAIKFDPSLVCLGESIGSGTDHRIYIACRTPEIKKIALSALASTKFWGRARDGAHYCFIELGYINSKGEINEIKEIIANGLKEALSTDWKNGISTIKY